MSNCMLSTLRFRELVDSSENPFPKTGDDLQALYELVGLPLGPFLQRNAVSDQVAVNLRKHCPSDLKPVWHHLKRIQDVLIAENLLEGAPLEPYFGVVAAIRDCVRDRRNDPGIAQPDWPAIVRWGRLRASLSPGAYSHSPEVMRTLYSRQFAVADATKRMSDAGFEYLIEGTDVFFSEAERLKMAAQIEEKILRLGPLNTAERLFASLAKVYEPEMQRYLLGRRVTALGTNTPPQVPIGYLLLLLAKHLDSGAEATGQASDSEDLWNDLCRFSADFAALYDYQPYSQFELLFVDAHRLPYFIAELAVYDRLFGFRQFRASDLPEAVRELFTWVTRTQEQALGWTIEAAADAVAVVVAGEPYKLGPRALPKNFLTNHGGIDPEMGRKLTELLTHASTPNAGFILPEHCDAFDLEQRPLIQGPRDSRILLDAAAGGPSVFAALAESLYTIDDNTFTKIGTAAEGFLAKRMQRRGVNLLRGTYRYPEAKGECDAIVETEDTIIFLELKIKSFTRPSQAGQDLSILFDLSRSLFQSIEQANKHEILLRKRGEILLQQPDGSSVCLRHDGRDIEKVAMTFDDFGSFQDRTVITQLFSVLINSRTNAIDRTQQDKADHLNKVCVRLRTQFEELGRLHQLAADKPFFNCWFLSIPQMLVLLDRTTSNSSFKDQLWMCRHMSTLSLDWYSEMATARSLACASNVQTPR